MSLSLILTIYLLAINVVTFFVYGIDKHKAKHHKWRIPENVLLFLAFIGGSIGAWLGMIYFHHKTNHANFKALVPIFMIMQLGLAIWFFFFR